MIGMLMNVVYGLVQKSEQKHITKKSDLSGFISKANVLMWCTCGTVNTSL